MKKLKLFLAVWTVGLFFGFVFRILKLTKRVEVFGYENLLKYFEEFAPKNKPLIVMPNHPSLWEPGLLPFLFFPQYLTSLRFVPFSLPDKKNFFDKNWFAPFRAVCVPIERGNRREELKTIFMLKDRFKEGGIYILFAEGGRTHLGKEFKIAIRSDNRIRKFPKGIERLFSGSCIVLPIWTKGGEKVIPSRKTFPRGPYFFYPRIWEKTKLCIGEPFQLPENLSKGEIREFLEDKLLEVSEAFWRELI